MPAASWFTSPCSILSHDMNIFIISVSWVGPEVQERRKTISNFVVN